MNFKTEFFIHEEPQKPAKNKLFHKLKYECEYRAWLRTRAGEAQNWKCCYCGVECCSETNHHNSATLEHVVPLSKGGEDNYENAAMACKRCNNSRGNDCYEEFMARKMNGNPFFGMSAGQAALSKKERLEAKHGRSAIKKAARLAENGWVARSGTQLDFWGWFNTLRGMDEKSKEYLIENYG